MNLTDLTWTTVFKLSLSKCYVIKTKHFYDEWDERNASKLSFSIYFLDLGVESLI